jgi:hypothetical protein
MVVFIMFKFLNSSLITHCISDMLLYVQLVYYKDIVFTLLRIYANDCMHLVDTFPFFK